VPTDDARAAFARATNASSPQTAAYNLAARQRRRCPVLSANTGSELTVMSKLGKRLIRASLEAHAIVHSELTKAANLGQASLERKVDEFGLRPEVQDELARILIEHKIAALRNRRGLTQAALARRSGVSKPMTTTIV